MKGQGTYDRIYTVVRHIPPGKVATYGQVARLAGLPGHARQVGYALHALPEKSTVPWHRVLNTRGEISLPAGAGARQRQLLEKEGIIVDDQDRISLEKYGWLSEGGVGGQEDKDGDCFR